MRQNTALSYNIEPVWDDSAQAVVQPKLDSMANNIIDEAVKSNASVIFLAMLWEACKVDPWLKNLDRVVKTIKHQCPNLRIVLIMNSWYQPDEQKLMHPAIDQVVFIDFFLTLVYHRVYNLGKIEFAQTWDPAKSKFLFLTGKPQKYNRIRLLYKFFQQKLLDRATWSFFMPEGAEKACNNLIPELSKTQFDAFVSSHLSDPDPITVWMQPGSLHYSGIPFDYKIYEDSKFQVVSETFFQTIQIKRRAWITEKTWLAILNRRPFIVASEPGLLEKLQHMGFCTFDQYLLIKDYNDIDNHEQRLDAVVQNTKFWLDNIQKYQQDIAKDVEHNYHRFNEIVIENRQVLQQLVEQYDVSCSADQVVTLHDPPQTDRWQIFYKNIKDPSWPDCPYEENFYNLPATIQQECINTFGYKPWKILHE